MSLAANSCYHLTGINYTPLIQNTTLTVIVALNGPLYVAPCRDDIRTNGSNNGRTRYRFFRRRSAPLFTTSETKQGDTATHSHSNTNRHLSYLVQPRLHGKRQRLPSLKVLWIRIFSFINFNEHERLSVRTLCRLFHTVLPGPTCAGVYTIYPHPNHPSLNSLMSRLNEMARVEGINVEHLFLANGVHVIEDEHNGNYGREVNMVNINLPISIIGESREHCIVMGGLLMNGKKEDDVNVSNLTLRESRGGGVTGNNGASMHLDNVSVENSAGHGVAVYCTKRSTMKNCNVSHSKGSGLGVAYGGLTKIDGNGTTIHHNCTNGERGYYGLQTWDSSSSIHLASYLTIEMISKNNGGGGNNGGTGKIKTVTNNTKEEKK